MRRRRRKATPPRRRIVIRWGSFMRPLRPTIMMVVGVLFIMAMTTDKYDREIISALSMLAVAIINLESK